MLPDNPYQSPQNESHSIPAAFTKHPTWKFWALISLALPGFIPQVLEFPVESDWITRGFFYFTTGCLVFSAYVIWWQWPTSFSNCKPTHKLLCVTITLLLSTIAAFYFGHFISWIAWLSIFGSPNWYYTTQSTRSLILLSGAPGACIPFYLGIALAFDAMGQPLRLRSMMTKTGIPRPR